MFFLSLLAKNVIADFGPADSALIQEIERKLEQQEQDPAVCETLKAHKLFFFYYRCRALRFKEVDVCKRFFEAHKSKREKLRPNVQNCEAPGMGLIEYTS